jgi:hypothetical protein
VLQAEAITARLRDEVALAARFSALAVVVHRSEDLGERNSRAGVTG